MSAVKLSGGYHGEGGEGYDKDFDGGRDDFGGDECGNEMMEVTMLAVFMIE